MRADDRREGRAGLHRRVDEDVARQREGREERRDAVGEEPQLADAEDREDRGERDRLGERQAARREGTRRRTRHPAVEVDLGDLVEGARARGDEGRAEERVQKEDRVEARERPNRSRGEAEEGGEDDEDGDARLRQLEEVRQVPLHAGAGAASPAGRRRAPEPS